MVWPHRKIHWHDEDNSAGDSETSKKERKTESRNGQEWILETGKGGNVLSVILNTAR